MQTITPTRALDTAKRPWWLLLSFGIALLLFGAIATFLCHMMYSGLEYLIDDFRTMGEDFWVGFVLVVSSSLMFLALASVVISEMRTVFRNSVAAAAHQAKLWRQARRTVVFCMGIVVLAQFVITVIPNRSLLPEISLIGAFLLLWFVSSTHAKWSSLLQRYEIDTQGSRE